MRTPLAVGVVGLGDCGRGIAQRLNELPQASLRWLCDLNREAHLRLRSQFPLATATADLDDLLEDESLDAVVIAAPPSARFDLARRALAADKHVLIREPVALRAAHAEQLLALAAHRDRGLAVANPLPFHPAYRKLKELIELDRLGEIFYLYADHETLVDERSDDGVLWSIGGDDLSLILHLLGDEAVEASGWGESYLQPGVNDVASCLLRFADGVAAQLHVSQLSPHRVRRLTVVGSKRTAIVDTLDRERPLTIYDKGGDVVSPRLGSHEPLRLLVESFVAAVRSGKEDLAQTRRAAAVVSTLEALETSAEAAAARRAVLSPPAREAKVVPLRLERR